MFSNMLPTLFRRTLVRYSTPTLDNMVRKPTVRDFMPSSQIRLKDLTKIKVNKDYLIYVENIVNTPLDLKASPEEIQFHQEAVEHLKQATKLYEEQVLRRRKFARELYDRTAKKEHFKRKASLYGVTLAVLASIVAIFLHSANLVGNSNTFAKDSDLQGVLDELKREDFLEKEKLLIEKTKSNRNN